MSTSIRNISVAIDGTKSSGFCIELDGTEAENDNDETYIKLFRR